jgi:hypothetical protein
VLLSALHLLQDVRTPSPGRPDLQDLCSPLFSLPPGLQGVELGHMQLYGVVYASPLLPEVLDPFFEVVDPARVHISYAYFLFLGIYGT